MMRMHIGLKWIWLTVIGAVTVTAGYWCHLHLTDYPPPTNIQSVSSLDQMTCSQGSRLYTLEQECQNHPAYNNISQESFWRFIVDESNKVVYCSIPKAGSTSVHHMMAVRLVGLRFLNSYPMQDIKAILKSYTKVVVVRHPLMRLYSAFNDRIYLKHLRVPQPYYDVVEHYYPGRTQNGTLNLNFEEFLKIVALEYKTGKFVNRHWMTYDQLCLPCLVTFDYIGKIESFESDSSGILYGFNSTKNPRMDNVHGDKKVLSLMEHYKNVGKTLMKKLLKVYETDFRLFGYDMHSLVLPECS